MGDLSAASSRFDYAGVSHVRPEVAVRARGGGGFGACQVPSSTNSHLARTRKGPLPAGTATHQGIEPADLQGARPPATPGPDRDRSALHKLRLD